MKKYSRKELLKLLLKCLLIGSALYGAVTFIGLLKGRIEKLVPHQNRPNIVLLVLDCWRYDHFSPEITPNIWAFAKKGVRFEDYFVNADSTLPSMMSIFSSVRPRYETEGNVDIGFRKFHEDPNRPAVISIDKDKVEALPKNLVTFPEVLKTFGYYTFAVIQNPLVGTPVGYDSKQWSKLDETTVDNFKLGAEQLVRIAIKGLAERSEQEKKRPFFLYIHFMDAHFPYNRTQLTEDKFGRQMKYEKTAKTNEKQALIVREALLPEMKEHYKSGVAYIDKQIPELISKIGELENPLFIITADHGEMFNEKGEILHGGSMPQEIVHVPLVIFGVKLKTKVDKKLRQGIDIAPTVLSLANCKMPPSTEGVNLLSDIEAKEVFSSSCNEDAYISKKGPLGDIEIVRTLRWDKKNYFKEVIPAEMDQGQKAGQELKSEKLKEVLKALGYAK